MLLFQNENLKDTIVIKGGFGVNELSRGLLYIETNDTEKLNPLLQQVVNTIHSLIPKNANMNVKNELYKLLIRFKSSGDHGSANTTKLIHTILKKSCIFLSGDNLAYVYSIANETPTLCRYYSGKLANDNEPEEDDEEDTEADTGQHFIAAYFPCGDNIEKYRIKMNEKISCIGRIFDGGYENPNYLENNTLDSEKMDIETDIFANTLTKIKTLTDKLDKYIEGLKTFVDAFDPDTISKENANKIQEILKEFDFKLLEQIPIYMKNIYLINEPNVYSYERMRTDLRILNNFTNNLYFLQKYTDIAKLTQIIIEEEVTALNEIADVKIFEIIPSQQIVQQSRRTSRHTGSTRINSLYKSLVNVFSKQKTPPSVNELLNTADKIGSQSSEKKSLKDNLIALKSRMAGIKHKLKIYLKNKLGFDEPFIADMNMKIENIKQPYVEKIIDKLSTVDVIGGTLKKLFYGVYIKDNADTDIEKFANENIQLSNDLVQNLKDEPIGNIVGTKERPILSKTKSVVKSLFKKPKDIVKSLFKKPKTTVEQNTTLKNISKNIFGFKGGKTRKKHAKKKSIRKYCKKTKNVKTLKINYYNNLHK